MSRLRANFAAAGALVERDLRVFASYRARSLTTLLNLFFSLTLFFYLSRLVSVSSFDSPDQYYAFAVIGLIILQVLNSVLNTPLIVRQELVAGTFERLLISPFGAVPGITAMMLFPFVFSMLSGVVMLIFGGVVFGLPVEWDTAWLAIPVATLGALAFGAFGVLFAALTIAFKQATGTAWVIAGISLIAGLYFPVELLPGWIQWTSDIQPFSATVELLRHVLIGYPLSDPAWLEVVRIAGFVVVLFPLALWLLTVAVRFSQQRGTIVEY
jgi:ABC-2 type transport system permease protein